VLGGILGELIHRSKSAACVCVLGLGTFFVVALVFCFFLGMPESPFQK